MDWDKFLGDLMSALIPLLVAVLTALISYCIAYIKKKTDLIKYTQLRQVIDDALKEAEQVAIDAVLATQQQLVDDLKAKSSDGKLTREEAEQALNAAFVYFKDHISQHSYIVLAQLTENLESWVKQLIEAKLGELKKF